MVGRLYLCAGFEEKQPWHVLRQSMYQGHLRKVWQRQQRLLRYQLQFKPHPPGEVSEQAYRSRHRATGSTDEGFRYPAKDGADILQTFSK